MIKSWQQGKTELHLVKETNGNSKPDKNSFSLKYWHSIFLKVDLDGIKETFSFVKLF